MQRLHIKHIGVFMLLQAVMSTLAPAGLNQDARDGAPATTQASFQRWEGSVVVFQCLPKSQQLMGKLKAQNTLTSAQLGHYFVTASRAYTLLTTINFSYNKLQMSS